MRLGLLARADETGLGYQTKAFYDHLKPVRTMVVDISNLNANQQHPEWYPGAQLVHGFPNAGDIDSFLTDLDVVLVAETPYNYYLYQRARELGVKTAVQYNYEFFDWFSHPDYPLPDLLIAPSRWHYDDIQAFATEHGIGHVYLHMPVDRSVFRYKDYMNETPPIIHIAGKSAVHDRNGTIDFLRLSSLIRHKGFNFRFIVYAQNPTTQIKEDAKSFGVEVIENISNPVDLYREGDLMILPRRYGGNCLPMNEAISCGLPVIMPNISPNNAFLPQEWLAPAQLLGVFKPRTEIEIWGIKVSEAVDTVLNVLGNIKEAKKNADKLAESISWATMRPKYEAELEKLCSR